MPARARAGLHLRGEDAFELFDELRSNATLTAMLAYLAAEDPVSLPRDRRVMAPDQTTKQPQSWPDCTPAARSSQESRR